MYKTTLSKPFLGSEHTKRLDKLKKRKIEAKKDKIRKLRRSLITKTSHDETSLGKDESRIDKILDYMSCVGYFYVYIITLCVICIIVGFTKDYFSPPPNDGQSEAFKIARRLVDLHVEFFFSLGTILLRSFFELVGATFVVATLPVADLLVYIGLEKRFSSFIDLIYRTRYFYGSNGSSYLLTDARTTIYIIDALIVAYIIYANFLATKNLGGIVIYEIRHEEEKEKEE